MASPSGASSGPRSRSDSLRDGSVSDDPMLRGPSSPDGPSDAESVPAEVLVEHLLAAKRSLSSMGMVLRANDLATEARQLHEDSVILAAQTAFLRRGVGDQLRLLNVVRRGMARAYKASKRDLTALLKTLDGANHRLEQTITMLRGTMVERVFRPDDDEKCLMDFVDEKSVEAMQTALKKSINELQAAQVSFHGDMNRFDDDLRTLKETLPSWPPLPSPPGSLTYQPMPHLLASLTTYSHAMAEHLASLNRHFDMCVTAVRTTEGGAALARRRAAEVTQSQDGGDPVSISGVIAEQESHVADFEPISAEERAEIVQVVVQDAPEVDEVVSELLAVLHQMEGDFGSVKSQAEQIQNAFHATITAFHVLEDVGSRLPGYVAAETEFVQRWEDEKEVIFARLEDMDELRRFYEGYANAYESLILEVERRRSVDDKIQTTWRKARETVDRILETERKEREHFRQEVGEFLPTDLWVGMNSPLRRWKLVPVDETREGGEGDVPEGRRKTESD